MVTPTTKMETGSKMPNLVSIIICQDFLESVPWLGQDIEFMSLFPDPGESMSDGRIYETSCHILKGWDPVNGILMLKTP